ncbi:MAG TPA: PAS domain S-box protein [Panacibacter sp.]|nr:PAS domain S-box protein [Panacibacter sp.]HNP45465.1 PAS domain S-box protein [Panacibacter sp.]
MPAIDFGVIFESLPGQYLILTPGFTIIAVSDSYLEATMTERPLLLGRNFIDVAPYYPVDKTISVAAGLADSLNTVLKSGQPHKMHARKYAVGKPGGLMVERYWAVLNTAVFDQQHKVAYIIHSLLDERSGKPEDITERKKSQSPPETLSRQVDQAIDAIFSTDTNRNIISWNKGAEKLYGYSKKEAIGQKVKDILQSPQSTQKNLAIVQSDLDENGYWIGEKTIKTKYGKDIYVRSSISVVKDENDVVTGFMGVSFDIGPQKQLKDQITHLADIADQTSEAIISRDLDQRIISWNKGAERLFGYGREEAIGKTVRDLGIIRANDSVVAETEKHIFENENWTFERRFYPKNGSSFLATVTANAIQHEQNGAKSIVFIIKDISLHKQLEEQLKSNNEKLEAEIKERTEDVVKKEKRFRTLIENNHDIIALIDSSLRIIYRSPSSTRITGWTDEDVLFENVTNNVHPEDKDKIAKITSEVMANPGKPVECRCRSRHKLGHYLWLEGVAINLLHDDTVQAILFNFRDVTGRIDAETKLATSESLFRALIENSDDIVTLMDDSFKLVYRSPAAAKVTGWTNEEMLGAIATKNIHPDDKAAAAETVKEILANPGKVIGVKFRMQHKKGHYLWIEGTFTNLLSDNYVKSIVFNFHDATKRIDAEKTLEEERLKFTKVAAISPGLIYSFRMASDGVMSFPWASDVFDQLFGVPYEQAANNVELIINAFHQPDKEILLSSIAASARDLSPWHLQFRYNHPKKGIVWLEGNSIPIREADGSVLWHGVISDVTERKVTEDKINEQNLQLKTLSDHIPGMMFYQITGDSFENRRFTYLSDSVTQLTGKTAAEVLADPAILYSLIAAEDLPGMIAAELESFNAIAPFNVEIRCRDYKGNLHWLNNISTPRKLNNGQVVWDGFQLDITAKKLAEQQKEFDQKNLSALINNTHDLIWSVDCNFNLITSNEAFDKLVYRITGKKPQKNRNVFYPALSNRVKERHKHYYLRAFSGETFTVTEHDEQANFWSEISFYPIYEGRSVIGTACYSRNITEKKKSEQALKRSFDEKQALALKLSAILNTLPANIALLDSGGNILEVNDSWRKFAEENGFEAASSCIGANYIDIFRKSFGGAAEDSGAVAEGLEAILRHKKQEFVFEYACHLHETKRWSRMIATALQDKAYAGAVVMHIDVTQLRVMEQERLHAKKEEQRIITKAILTGQERERNHIGRELHDNINQLLTGTKIYLSLAGHKNKEVKEVIQYPMELIDASIKEIRSLCHDMVTPLNNIHLQELLGDLITKLQQTEKIKTDYVYTVPDGIVSEELQLNIYRIVQELVNNILKHADAENVTVIVEINERHINITVTDDGKGFDTTKKRNGIGISNIINRVESFDGAIRIESTPGKGCKTSIDIPY